MTVEAITFTNSQGLTLRGFVHLPEKSQSKRKAFIYLHGFPGHCTGSAARFCSRMEARGYLCLRFDFSGSDSSEGEFSDKLMSQEVKDVGSAIDFLFEHYADQFDELILAGCSTGAIDASLYAHTDSRVGKLILLAGVSDLTHAVHYDFSEERIAEFEAKGEIVYDWEEWFYDEWFFGKSLKRAFYDEFFVLDIPAALRAWKGATLILHGTEDAMIPVSKDPHELYALCNDPKQLVIMEGAVHNFAGHEDEVVRVIDEFIQTDVARSKHKQVGVASLYDSEGKILLQERKSMSKFGEEWGFFGGKIELGESPEEATIRELQEELELTVTTEEMKFLKQYKGSAKRKEGFEQEVSLYVFKVPLNHALFETLVLHEGDSMQWFTVEEALKLQMSPWDKDILEDLQVFLKDK